MSAIAHWIEQHGINTVVIGLIRLHLEKILPPRSLWVPFELGRPLGAPNDSSQQHQVLLQALQMVETATPGQIVNFNEDDSRARLDDRWRAPDTDQCISVSAECAQLKPCHEKFVASKGRSSVGVSGIAIDLCAEIVDHVIDKAVPAKSPREGVSDLLMLRLAIDDLKAYYLEAALSETVSDNTGQTTSQGTGYPSSRQLHNWFWLDTFAGAQLRQLRENLLQSQSAKLAGLARLFFVPHRWRISP